MRVRSTWLLILVGLIVSVPGRAQLLFTLNPAGQTGTPGATLTYNGTLTNSGTVEVFLNGAFPSITGAGLSVDDNPFFDNFPFSLAAGDSATADIFRVTVDPGVTPGDYLGTFAVLGGANDSAQDTLARQNFLVNVVGPAAATPEPGPLALLAGCLLPFTALRLLRRRPRPL